MLGKFNYSVMCMNEQGQIETYKVQYLADVDVKVRELLGKKEIQVVIIHKIQELEIVQA